MWDSIYEISNRCVFMLEGGQDKLYFYIAILN